MKLFTQKKNILNWQVLLFIPNKSSSVFFKLVVISAATTAHFDKTAYEIIHRDCIVYFFSFKIVLFKRYSVLLYFIQKLSAFQYDLQILILSFGDFKIFRKKQVPVKQNLTYSKVSQPYFQAFPLFAFCFK